MYSSAPFIIQPADDLISQHPALKQLSHQLALKYVHQELVTDNDLQIIGSQLWRALDCTEAYDKACQKAGMAILPLIILSDQAALQQLPWETLYHPEKHFMGKDIAFSLSRQIVSKEHQPTAFPPEKGPLKILLFTSLTDDQARLDIEKEQEQVQEALLPWISRGQVQLEMPNDGRFSSFQQVLKQYQPHLVFLSGHGKFYDKDLIAKQTEDYATFAFEDETSTNSKEIEAKTLATAFIGTAVQAVVLSACQSGKSASDKLSTGLMQQLAIQGITHVIGMRESIFDRAGTLFAREFCDQIAQQARIDLALQAARRAITQPLKDPADSMAAELSYGQWCLPLLISQDPARALIDWQFEAQKPTFSSETLTLQNIPLAQHFIGRRKEQRELITALQSRQQTQLLITGAGGQGKTALAGQLAQTLQQQGWTILAWSAQPENQWRDFLRYMEAQLNEVLRQHYTASWLQNEHDKATTLLTLLAQQAKGKLLLFFDNLESVQNPTTRNIDERQKSVWHTKFSQLLGKNPTHFALWIQAAQQLSNKGVSLLLTSRWKTPNWQESNHLVLTHCSYNDYLALVRQKVELHSLLSNKEKLRELHKTLHGNARALNFFAAALQELDRKEEAHFLQALKKANAESQQDMALALIIRHRSPAEQDLLNRLQAYTTPVPIEGLIKLSRVNEKPEFKTLENPRELIKNLLHVSLLEKTFSDDYQQAEYQLSSQVNQWLQQNNTQPTLPLFIATAEYHQYLYQHERETLSQAIILHQALQLAEQQTEAEQLALNNIAPHLSHLGFYQTVLQHWLPTLCESKDDKTRGDALGQTGKQLHHLGHYETALTYLKRSLHITQKIGDKSGEGTTLNNISQIYKARGDYETALTYLKRSLHIRQKIGDKSGEGTTLNNISQIYKARGDYKTALTYLKRSLHITQKIGDKSGLCATLFNMGHIYLQNEQQQEALEAWVTVYKIAKPMGEAQVLEALEGLAGQLDLEGGLDAWERLAKQMGR